MANGSLANKLEVAAKAVFEAAGISGTTVYTGQDGVSRTLPSLSLHAGSQSESPLNSGNKFVEFVCRLESSSDISTLTEHRDRAEAVEDVLADTGFFASLSAALGNFFAFGYREFSGELAVEDRNNVSEWRMQIYCCATDL